MSERSTLLPYLSDPGWLIGRSSSSLAPVSGGRSKTNGEIRIENGKLLLFDYLADDPTEPILACPVREVSASPLRLSLNDTVRLELGTEGTWYLKAPSSRLKNRRRETRRLIEAIAQAQRVAQ